MTGGGEWERDGRPTRVCQTHAASHEQDRVDSIKIGIAEQIAEHERAIADLKEQEFAEIYGGSRDQLAGKLQRMEEEKKRIERVLAETAEEDD